MPLFITRITKSRSWWDGHFADAEPHDDLGGEDAFLVDSCDLIWFVSGRRVRKAWNNQALPRPQISLRPADVISGLHGSRVHVQYYDGCRMMYVRPGNNKDAPIKRCQPCQNCNFQGKDGFSIVVQQGSAEPECGG